MANHLGSSPSLLLSCGPSPICPPAGGSGLTPSPSRSMTAVAVGPSPPSIVPLGRPLRAQSRPPTPGLFYFLQNAWAVAFLAYFPPPLPTDHSLVPFLLSSPPPLPSPPLKQMGASKREKHRNCQMQFLSGDDKFAAICISKQELQFLSGPPPKHPPSHSG